MSKTIRNNFTSEGRHAYAIEVLKLAVSRLTSASARGGSLKLSAEEVRALDWSVIHECTTPCSEEDWLNYSFEQYLAAKEDRP